MCDKKPANLTITVPEKVYTTIDAQTLAKMMANGEDVSIVDVRDEDFVGGSMSIQLFIRLTRLFSDADIKGALHIPYGCLLRLVFFFSIKEYQLFVHSV